MSVKECSNLLPNMGNIKTHIGTSAQFTYQKSWIYAFLFYIYVNCYNNFSRAL
ncbi:hypothetical protein SAMN05518672_10572 [Chitinophaga sp. CF118]|nr:hypothetical protein SAMN05518672_10572 [Chitinophaga sp. CF118]